MEKRRTTISADTRRRFERVHQEVESFYNRADIKEITLKNYQFVISVAEYINKKAIVKKEVLATPFTI